MAKAKTSKAKTTKRIGRPVGSKSKPKATSIPKRVIKRNFLRPRVMWGASKHIAENAEEFSRMTKPEAAEKLTEKFGTLITACNVITLSRMANVAIGERRLAKGAIHRGKRSIASQIHSINVEQRELKNMLRSIMVEFGISSDNGLEH